MALSNDTVNQMQFGIGSFAAANELALAVNLSTALLANTAPVGANTVAYPKTSTGSLILLAASTTAGNVIIVATVTTTFANGDGAQPTFSIGYAGSASAFAATSAFTGATAGTTTIYAGTLPPNTALLVTATAGTGTTETGALSITAMVVG